MPHVLRHQRVHRIPPHVRDDAYVPLHRGGMATVNRNFRKNESKIFLRGDLEQANRVDAARKIRICAHAIFAFRIVLRCRNVGNSHPTGESKSRVWNPLFLGAGSEGSRNDSAICRFTLVTNAERYAQLAKQYGDARVKALDHFSRDQLETLERSYRILAESEAALQRSLKLAQRLGKPG